MKVAVAAVFLAAVALCSSTGYDGSDDANSQNSSGLTYLQRHRLQQASAAQLGWPVDGTRVAKISIIGDLKSGKRFRKHSTDDLDNDCGSVVENKITRLYRDDDLNTANKPAGESIAEKREATLASVRELLSSKRPSRYGMSGSITDVRYTGVLLGTQVWLSGDILVQYTKLLKERADESGVSAAVGLVELRPEVSPGDIFSDYVSAKYKMNAFKMDITRIGHAYAIVHIDGCHWVLVAVDVAARKARVYDSLVGPIAAAQKSGRSLTDSEMSSVYIRMQWLLERVEAWLRAEEILSAAVDKRLAARGVFVGSDNFSHEWRQELCQMVDPPVVEIDSDTPIDSHEIYRWEIPETAPGPWNVAPAYDAPQQDNGIDCGVFSAMLADKLLRGEDPSSVRQEDMVAHRRMLCEAVMLGRLPNDTRPLRPIVPIISKRK